MKKKPARPDFPALDRLLEEMSRLKERERIQPRLPFDLPPVESPGRLPSGKIARKAARVDERPVIKDKRQR